MLHMGLEFCIEIKWCERFQCVLKSTEIDISHVISPFHFNVPFLSVILTSCEALSGKAAETIRVTFQCVIEISIHNMCAQKKSEHTVKLINLFTHCDGSFKGLIIYWITSRRYNNQATFGMCAHRAPKATHSFEARRKKKTERESCHKRDDFSIQSYFTFHTATHTLNRFFFSSLVM